MIFHASNTHQLLRNSVLLSVVQLQKKSEVHEDMLSFGELARAHNPQRVLLFGLTVPHETNDQKRLEDRGVK